MTEMQLFSERFKLLRLSAGLKQNEIGEKLGVSRGAISFYENGDRVPDIAFLAQASKYFNVSADWFLGLSDAKTKDREIAAVCDYTGLDEETIALFRKLKQNPHWNEVISYILRIAEIMEG